MLQVSCNGLRCHRMPDLSDGLTGCPWSNGPKWQWRFWLMQVALGLRSQWNVSQNRVSAGLYLLRFERFPALKICCHPHWLCSCSQRVQLNKYFLSYEGCWHRVLTVGGEKKKKKDTDFKRGWCWWIFKNVIWCFIAWIQMCLRAHVSFALADVPGPAPAARADRFSLAADHQYHSIQKKM